MCLVKAAPVKAVALRASCPVTIAQGYTPCPIPRRRSHKHMYIYTYSLQNLLFFGVKKKTKFFNKLTRLSKITSLAMLRMRNNRSSHVHINSSQTTSAHTRARTFFHRSNPASLHTCHEVIKCLCRVLRITSLLETLLETLATLPIVSSSSWQLAASGFAPYP